MIAIVLCICSLVVCYLAGRRSLAQGLIAILAFGYFYGIVRANVPTTFSHFIFDSGLIGFYASQQWTSVNRSDNRNAAIRLWLVLLMGWPLLVVFMPFQPFLVSLVGLRGNIFLLPLLLLGTRLKENDLLQLANGLAFLNLVAFAFASAEYFTSVQLFYPFNAVTQIIYNSADAGGGFYRIPAIFTSAHAFGGTMSSTLPILICGWTRAQTPRLRTLALLGVASALLGILLSATRLNFIIGCVAILVTIFTVQMKTSSRMIFAVLIAALGLGAMSNVRFQRFKSLGDTDSVAERLAGSVNRGFMELLTEYPMGNGLGGGGTSIPYFLQGQVRNPIGLESEYSRILCEQGFIGLLLWIGFILWYLAQAPIAFRKDPLQNARRLTWCLSMFGFVCGLIGLGSLTSIPLTVLLLVGMSWAVTPPLAVARNHSELAQPDWRQQYGPALR